MADERPVHGTFCWNELVTRDPDKARKFYKDLIGWEFKTSEMGDMKYEELMAGERMAGGFMEMPAEVPKEVPSHWMSYITVDDVDSVVSKVADLGGAVLNGPHEIPKVGRMVTIQDPTGATVSLISFPKK